MEPGMKAAPGRQAGFELFTSFFPPTVLWGNFFLFGLKKALQEMI